MPVSFKAEVIADNTGKWAGNALRFATREEAERYVADLYARWTLVRETRVVESDDPVNYCITAGGKLERVYETGPCPLCGELMEFGDEDPEERCCEKCGAK